MCVCVQQKTTSGPTHAAEIGAALKREQLDLVVLMQEKNGAKLKQNRTAPFELKRVDLSSERSCR